MLKELRIKNLAIIDDLQVRFEKGLNVLTGETGAGKSIIVDSLNLALGSRAQSEFIRSGEKEAVVQAYFEIRENRDLPDIGVDMSEGLILRRSLSSAGKSRAYINDMMVSIQSLNQIGRAIVDIHGQHEHQSLLSLVKHREFLDAFGNLQKDCEQMTALFKEVEVLKHEVSELQQRVKERAHRMDLLKFQVNEIHGANLKAGEKEELTDQRTILTNISKLNEAVETVYALLYGSEGACIEKLSLILTKLKEIATLDHSVSDILKTLESVYPLLEDAAQSLRGYKDKYDIEHGKLDEVEDRLECIRRLEKKYGEGIEGILLYCENANKELTVLQHADERLDTLEEELKRKEAVLLSFAGTLSEKRKRVAKTLEKHVRNELKDLAFANAQFLVNMEQDILSAHGFDRIEFLFSANPGEPPRPLAKIASGGELSRVMLALKTVLANYDDIPVLIFDEVDAGIGGKAAEKVGSKLKAISSRHQVLCTTHLPQIASLGDLHVKIEKVRRDGRATVGVMKLSGSERIQEIARMLSGSITEVSLRHAKELIESTL